MKARARPGSQEFEVDLKLFEDVDEIVFPIWSEENGQDDLVWYPAKKIAPGHFQLRFQAQKHKGNGLFHLHVYQKSQGQLKGLFPTTFQVEKAKPKLTPLATHPGNTYPIGECTWGAKELAPWAHNWWGNGGMWAASARAAGFRTGDTPEVGAIACWDNGGYGHVALVTDVEHFPLIPVILLFVFSPLMYKGIRMEVVTALLVSTFVALILDGIRRMNLKESIGTIKTFAQGMGKVFTSTVFLIVCAEVFAAGLTKSGGIAEIINSVSGMQAGGYAVFTVMFLIVVGSAFVMGSGNAAFFSFAPMIPDIAAKVGLNAAFMISPLQLASGMARSSSPIAGVTIAIAGLSGLNPFDLIRRSIPVMVIAIIATYLRSLMLI